METSPPHYNTSQHPEPSFNLTRFIVLQSTVTLFTIISAYVTIALLFFECKKLGSKFRSQGQRLRMEKNGRYAVAMRYESIIAAVFLLGRLLCEQYELLAQYLGVTYDYCDVIVKVKVALSSIAVSGVYMFLWTRQRFCYSEPAMQHLSSRLIKAMSWISLLLLALVQIVGTILFLVTRFYEMTCLGCVNHMTTIPNEIPWIFIGAVTVCFQSLLFFLFVFPLVKHKTAIGSEPRTGFRKFLPLIKRTAVMTSVCIATDLISSLLILLARDNNEIIPTLAYDVSLLTNVICVVASFSDWKVRFFAPLCCYGNDSHAVSLNAVKETRGRGVSTLPSPSGLYSVTSISPTTFANVPRNALPELPLNGPFQSNSTALSQSFKLMKGKNGSGEEALPL